MSVGFVLKVSLNVLLYYNLKAEFRLFFFFFTNDICTDFLRCAALMLFC